MLPNFLKAILHPFRPFYLPLIHTPKPEPDLLRVCRRHLSHEDVVVEVGARIGGGTLFLSDLVKHVYTFEPNPNSFRVLRSYTKNRKNVDIFDIALGSKMGEALLNLPEKYGSSYSSSEKMVSGSPYSHRLKVKVLPLDDIELELTPTCLLLDCEGSEVEVLRGAKRTLGSVNKVLVETHPLQDGRSTLKDVRTELETTFLHVETFEPGFFSWVIATRSLS